MTENNKIGCNDIAKAIQNLMTMANLSGFISQDDNESFRQFDVSSITGNEDNATMLLNISNQGFKMDISYDPDYQKSEEA